MKQKLHQVIQDLEKSSNSITENFNNGVVNGFTEQPYSQGCGHLCINQFLYQMAVGPLGLRSEEQIKELYDVAKKQYKTQYWLDNALNIQTNYV